MLWVAPLPATYVLLLPFLITSAALMFGNWSQHIFVARRGADGLGNTYNCVRTPENQLTFNDGYHVMHHLNSHTHWAALPRAFLDRLEELDDAGALTFEGYAPIQARPSVHAPRLTRCPCPCYHTAVCSHVASHVLFTPAFTGTASSRWASL